MYTIIRGSVGSDRTFAYGYAITIIIRVCLNVDRNKDKHGSY